MGCVMINDLRPDVFYDTLKEHANPDEAPLARVMARLLDWQDRVHALYTDIEHALSGAYLIDRTEKRVVAEVPFPCFDASRMEIPPVDILRVEDLAGSRQALIEPRALWVIGNNGRLHLRVNSRDGAKKFYFVTDRSRPLIPPAAWVIAPLGGRTEEQPFSGETLRAMLAR
jgi:hypothetical protein